MSFREKLVRLVGVSAMSALVGVGSGCSGPVDGVGVDRSKIVGGNETSGDPSVVMIFAYGRGGGLCTGEVIAPRAVLTAAHCVDPTEVGAGANFVIYNGPNMSKALFSDFIRAKEGIKHPDFNIDDVGGGKDIGLLIFDRDITDKEGKPYALLDWNRKPITDEMVGQPVRFVGYGVTSGDPQVDDSGIKRETTSTLSSYDDMLLGFYDQDHNTCSGDSGGPAFMNIDGKETTVGVTSFGETPFGGVDCENGGYDTRVDLYVDWIDSVIEEKTGWIHPSKRPTKVLGDDCAESKECTGGICTTDTKSGLNYCTTTCDPNAKDPAGYHCADVEGANILLRGDEKKGGCNASGGADVGGAFGFALLAAALIARRRLA